MSEPQTCECGCFRPGTTYHTPEGSVTLCDECREHLSETAEEMGPDDYDPCPECGEPMTEGVCDECDGDGVELS